MVALSNCGDVALNLLHESNEFVTLSGAGVRLQSVYQPRGAVVTGILPCMSKRCLLVATVEVQLASADAGHNDPDYGIMRFLNG